MSYYSGLAALFSFDIFCDLVDNIYTICKYVICKYGYF